ncbi:MAG: hypothetical protein HFG25_04500 [Lachnospiraceae bacterium]|nr:hypothetical protein [Lachnospiraceae bacterium]
MKKQLSLILGAILIAASLTGCGKDEKPQENSQQGTNQSTEQSDDSQSGQQTDQESSDPGQEDPGLAQGTSFNSIDDYNFEAPQEGVWQYYFSGDNGETFDKCTTYDDYPDSKVRGWHPWTGSYIGVGFNDDMEGFLELNTDGVSKDWSNQMGVLAFEAPVEGRYVITAKVWNPWSQPCDNFTFKKGDGTEVLSVDMSEIVDNYAYVTPTDVQLAQGELLYIFCNSTEGSWVSAYIDCTMVYDPQDDSVYQVPEVEAREVAGVDPDFGKTAEHNAYQEFNKDTADGSSSPWIYASTMDGSEFTPAAEYRDTDYGANEWFTEGGTGMGQVNYVEGEYLELNTPGNGAEIMALGFRAPAEGTYTFSGYTFNPYSQSCEAFHLSLNGEEKASVDIADYTAKPNEFTVEIAMAEGDVLYFYCPSTTADSWVSAYLSVFVNAQ